MGWLGNAFILIGMYLVGEKRWYAFIFSIVGELIWAVYAYSIGMLDLAAICIVFCFVAGINMEKWRRYEQNQKASTDRQ